MDRVALKTKAKEQIGGNLGVLILMSLISVGFSLLASFIPVVGNMIYTYVVNPAIWLSFTMVYLNMANGGSAAVGDIFSGFNDMVSAMLVNFFVSLFTFLWALLFIVPGIIKSYSYSQAIYILAENPKMSALEAIRRSKTMMEGHKMELFMLDLSFIGWILLSICTCGILLLWVGPYMNAAHANFYNSIKNESTIFDEF